MKFQEKMQLLRKQKGYSQEQLAEHLGIARQTVSKWENGQGVPELGALIGLSKLYAVTIDRMVKEEDDCNISLNQKAGVKDGMIRPFLIRAKKNTYAGKAPEVESSRKNSHDFRYEEGAYAYYDTYLGGEQFAGEEGVWYQNTPIWSMNYVGRVIGECFDGDFLKEALKCATEEHPYRGPEIFTQGDYHYHCKVDGEFSWFQGYEEIFCGNHKIYECLFHGGSLK